MVCALLREARAKKKAKVWGGKTTTAKATAAKQTVPLEPSEHLLQERFNAGYSAALAQMTWPNWYTNTQEGSAASSSHSDSLAPEQKTKIYEASYII